MKFKIIPLCLSIIYFSVCILGCDTENKKETKNPAILKISINTVQNEFGKWKHQITIQNNEPERLKYSLDLDNEITETGSSTVASITEEEHSYENKKDSGMQNSAVSRAEGSHEDELSQHLFNDFMNRLANKVIQEETMPQDDVSDNDEYEEPLSLTNSLTPTSDELSTLESSGDNENEEQLPVAESLTQTTDEVSSDKQYIFNPYTFNRLSSFEDSAEDFYDEDEDLNEMIKSAEETSSKTPNSLELEFLEIESNSFKNTKDAEIQNVLLYSLGEKLNENEPVVIVELGSTDEDMFKQVKGEMEKKGYTYYDNYGFYKYHQIPANWDVANETCISEGGHLAVLNSESEAKLVLDIFQTYPMSNVQEPLQMLLGFHDKNTEGQFETVTGGFLKDSGYVKWGRGQPDNGDWENCGTIVRYSGWLNDFPCHYVANFMCELEWPNKMEIPNKFKI